MAIPPDYSPFTKPSPAESETARLLEPDTKESAKDKELTSLANSVSTAVNLPASDIKARAHVPRAPRDIQFISVETIIRNIPMGSIYDSITAKELIDALNNKQYELTWGGHCIKFQGHDKSFSYSELIQLAMKANASDPSEQTKLIQLVQELNPSKTASGVAATFYGAILKVIHYFSSSESMLCSKEIDHVFTDERNFTEINQNSEDFAKTLERLGGANATALFNKYYPKVGEHVYRGINGSNGRIKAVQTILSKLNLAEAEAFQLKVLEEVSKKEAAYGPIFDQEIRNMFKSKNYSFSSNELHQMFNDINGLVNSTVNYRNHLMDTLETILTELIPDPQALQIFKMLYPVGIWNKDVEGTLELPEKGPFKAKKLQKKDLESLSSEQLTLMHSIYQSYPGLGISTNRGFKDAKIINANKEICQENAELCRDKFKEFISNKAIAKMTPERALVMGKMAKSLLIQIDYQIQEQAKRCFIHAVPASVHAADEALALRVGDYQLNSYLNGLTYLTLFKSLYEISKTDPKSAVSQFREWQKKKIGVFSDVSSIYYPRDPAALVTMAKAEFDNVAQDNQGESKLIKLANMELKILDQDIYKKRVDSSPLNQGYHADREAEFAMIGAERSILRYNNLLTSKVELENFKAAQVGPRKPSDLLREALAELETCLKAYKVILEKVNPERLNQLTQLKETLEKRIANLTDQEQALDK